MSKPMAWLRLWCDIRSDLRFRREPIHVRWAWIITLIIAREQNNDRRGYVLREDGTPLDYRDLADAAAITPRQAKEAWECFTSGKNPLVITIKGLPYIDGWERRQFESDVSTDRVKRYRVKRSKSVSETEVEHPQTSDTDTDTERTPISPLDIETLKVLHRYSGWNGDKTAAKNFTAFHADFPRHDLDACAKSWATWAGDAKNPPKNCWLSFRNWVARTEAVKPGGKFAGII